MNKAQLKFMTLAKRVVEDKTRSQQMEDLINRQINISQIEGFSSSELILTYESLELQEYVTTIKKRGENIKFYLTPKGIESINEGLLNYGKSQPQIDINISTEFITALNELMESVSNSNKENQEFLLEILDSIKNESTSKNPKKNVIKLLLGVAGKQINNAATFTTLLSYLNISQADIMAYLQSVI
ncbi:hypothetical protein [Anaerosolibacter sp.]|uniref:hypothetical protein n=1 Tax=Anaerosolibacter sp. TaxID=1872527 RepID=UPI0039EE9516